MNRVVISEIHKPSMKEGIIGCGGYTKKPDRLYCLIVNGDGLYLNDGIVNGSIVYVDADAPYEIDKLNVFVNDVGQYELSVDRRCDDRYLGRVIMAINKYE